MFRTLTTLPFLGTLIGCAPVHADQPAPTAPAIEHPGCFLLYDVQADLVTEAGEQDCSIATAPASTFKIPHALIALQTEVITDATAEVRWDGTPQRFATWERDHDLISAIGESVVWFFQRTAVAIGRTRMQAHLQAFDYGNADVSGELTTFWLGGPGSSLQIDGHQQLKFLRRLFAGALEVDPGHLHTVQSAMVRTPASLAARMPKDYRLPSASPDNPLKLWVKTGTAALRNQGSVTWLVGQVERDGRRFVFVSRVVDPNSPPRVVSPAVTHGLDALAQLGLMG